MALIKINKNVPIPESHGSRALKYPYATMKVGDNFLFSTNKDQKTRMLCSASYSGFSRLKTKGKWKFTLRTTDEGIYVWRIK